MSGVCVMCVMLTRLPVASFVDRKLCTLFCLTLSHDKLAISFAMLKTAWQVRVEPGHMLFLCVVFYQ